VVVDGILYEKGWGLIAEPRMAHALEENFSHPARFDPDRFLGEASVDRRYSFIPFGGGVHACLGAQLAITVARIFAIQVLHSFDWQGLGVARFRKFPLRMIKSEYRVRLTARSQA